MTGNKSHRSIGNLACNGDPGISKTADSSSNTGHYPKIDCFLQQAVAFLRISAENKGIAALEIGRSVTFSPMVEYVYGDSPGGVAGQNRAVLTLAGQMDWNGFNLAVAWTCRDTDNGTNEDDFQFQFSVGYAFDYGLSVDIGWKIAEGAGIDTQALGVLAAYKIEF